MLEDIMDLLSFEGFEVIGAANGQRGVEMAQQHLPDLIISDIMMPILDGYGVLMTLQSDARTASIPFLFLTALASSDDRRTAMNLGADDYLTKPFSREQLLSSVKARLDRQQLLTEAFQKRISHLQDTIMITLPHELRTPLSSISGYTELLYADVDTMSPSQIRSMVEGIRRGTNRLHRLIENYLLFAQLEIKKHEEDHVKDLLAFYQANPIYPADDIQQNAEQIAQNAKREADLELNLEPLAVAIPLDELSKIASELIDNAFKFSDPGTPVVVALYQEGNSTVLTITDQGRGMFQEYIEKIQAYTQFDRKLYEQQGLGLGLAIVKLMTQLFNGEFSIESEAGHGTRVRVSFEN